MCEEGLHQLLPQSYHLRLQIEGDAAEVTMSGVCPHTHVNHTVFFLFHGFIIFMYINNILMKQLNFILGVNYFVLIRS